MPKTITISDLPTDNAGFLGRFRSFSVHKERDGKGGAVFMGTVSMSVLDSDGNEHKVASLTKEIPPAMVVTLRGAIMANYLADLKAQEGL